MSIKNNIGKLILIPRTQLNNYQWDLKEDMPWLILDLKREIEEHWFNAPVYVWKNNNNYILDWHQRLKALNLLADEWYTLPDDNVPCVEIVAEDEKEARQRVAEYNSSFSELNKEFAQEFFVDVEFEHLHIKTDGLDFEIEEVDLEIPEDLDWEAKNNPYAVKISTKEWKEKIDMLMGDIEEILKSYDCFEWSFSWGEL